MVIMVMLVRLQLLVRTLRAAVQTILVSPILLMFNPHVFALKLCTLPALITARSPESLHAGSLAHRAREPGPASFGDAVECCDFPGLRQAAGHLNCLGRGRWERFVGFGECRLGFSSKLQLQSLCSAEG